MDFEELGSEAKRDAARKKETGEAYDKQGDGHGGCCGCAAERRTPVQVPYRSLRAVRAIRHLGDLKDCAVVYMYVPTAHEARIAIV